MPIDWKMESQRFNGVAEIYEMYRPSYPAQLVDDIVNLSGIQSKGRILEVGSGTGKATRLFAEKGFSIVCLEPGQNLIDVAKKSLKPYPQVQFEKSRFEVWDAGEKEFDLLVSAQAFHWVPQEVRFAKAASVLKQQGHLAIFWNMYPGIDSAIGHELNEIYRKLVPEMARGDVSLEQLIQKRANSLREDARFENVTVKKYPWAETYKTQQYLGLLNTYSDHLRLSEQRRRGLFAEIAALIDQYGGQIERPYLAALYMARKK